MEIGNKILELRKKNNYSQEELAEKIGVARQTISKWELGETAPDIRQSKQLANLFNVSLDELTNNDIKDILIAKVSNTEKYTKIIINILKIICLSIIILVIILISTLYFKEYFEVKPNAIGKTLTCTINEKEYIYEVWTKYDSPNVIENFYTTDEEININKKDYNNSNALLKDIEENVVSRGGICENWSN